MQTSNLFPSRSITNAPCQKVSIVVVYAKTNKRNICPSKLVLGPVCRCPLLQQQWLLDTTTVDGDCRALQQTHFIHFLLRRRIEREMRTIATTGIFAIFWQANPKFYRQISIFSFVTFLFLKPTWIVFAVSNGNHATFNDNFLLSFPSQHLGKRMKNRITKKIKLTSNNLSYNLALSSTSLTPTETCEIKPIIF